VSVSRTTRGQIAKFVASSAEAPPARRETVRVDFEGWLTSVLHFERRYCGRTRPDLQLVPMEGARRGSARADTLQGAPWQSVTEVRPAASTLQRSHEPGAHVVDQQFIGHRERPESDPLDPAAGCRRDRTPAKAFALFRQLRSKQSVGRCLPCRRRRDNASKPLGKGALSSLDFGSSARHDHDRPQSQPGRGLSAAFSAQMGLW
jgi:hypothetical protein